VITMASGVWILLIPLWLCGLNPSFEIGSRVSCLLWIMVVIRDHEWVDFVFFGLVSVFKIEAQRVCSVPVSLSNPKSYILITLIFDFKFSPRALAYAWWIIICTWSKYEVWTQLLLCWVIGIWIQYAFDSPPVMWYLSSRLWGFCLL